MYKLSNPNASKEAVALLDYLSSVYGKKLFLLSILKTPQQPELAFWKNLQKSCRQICGFELLGYSPNVNYTDTDEEAITEIMENTNTIDTAIDWALNKKGIVTYTWHWYSPMRGHNKSFYTRYTDFDLGSSHERKLSRIHGNYKRYKILWPTILNGSGT